MTENAHIKVLKIPLTIWKNLLHHIFRVVCSRWWSRSSILLYRMKTHILWHPCKHTKNSKGSSFVVFQPVATCPFPLFQIPVFGIPLSWVADSQAPPMIGLMQFSHDSGASSSRSNDYESRSSQGTSSNDTKSQSYFLRQNLWIGFLLWAICRNKLWVH